LQRVELHRGIFTFLYYFFSLSSNKDWMCGICFSNYSLIPIEHDYSSSTEIGQRMGLSASLFSFIPASRRICIPVLVPLLHLHLLPPLGPVWMLTRPKECVP
jgi:hypothetical protein